MLTNKHTMSYRGTPGADQMRGGQFQQGHRPQNSVDLAKQYEVDMHQITRCVFLETDPQGYKIETYLSHVRIIEDSKSPSSRPPPNSPQSNKKDRFLILSIKASGRMRLHKAKESSSGIIQIGRSWDFDELSSLELDDESPTGFICTMGKAYYWEVHTPKERRVWCTTLLEHFIKYTDGKTPTLINCSVEYFHLEVLYDSFKNDTRGNATKNLQPRSPKVSTHNNPSNTVSSPTRGTSKSFANLQRSPIKQSSPDTVTSLKKNLASPPLSSTPYNGNGMNSAVSSTAVALSGTAAATNIANKTDKEQAKLLMQKQKEEELLKRKKEQEAALKAANLEARRKQEIEKRRQQELERRKQEELERRRQEELERRRQEQEELEGRGKEQEELERQIHQQEKVAKQRELEKLRLGQERSLSTEQFRPPRAAELVKRGPPSSALSEAPSQMSFEYGDESKFQIDNRSLESDMNEGVDSYIDNYASDGGEAETAPLNLILPKPRSRANAVPPTLKASIITKKVDKSDSSLSLKATGNSGNQLATPTDELKKIENKLDVSNPNRSRAFSRVSEIEPDSNDLLEILEELGYDPILDDSASIQKKLLKELDRLQYDKIQTLTQVTRVTSALKQSINLAFQNCDHIDPILSLFGVELSVFKDDVDFIEDQGQGLQVEATNENLLINELNDIVHSVEISDLKLQKLLTSKITLGNQNTELESILNELYSALLKMNDNDSNGETSGAYQLSKMNALQEKKKIFESAKNEFIRNCKESCRKLFESVSLSLSSKLEQINSDTFESKFLKTIFLDKLATLLTINGLVSFIRSVSTKDYDEILNMFVKAFKPFFENISNILLRNLNQQVSLVNISQFSFNSEPSTLITEKYMGSRNKKDLGKRSIFGNDDDKNKSKSQDEIIISSINQYCSQILNVISIQQEFIKSFFGLSSSTSYLFQNLVKTPIEKRCEEFITIPNFLNTPIESDRSVSDDIFEIMKQLFDFTFSLSLKAFIAVAKSNILETPAILCLLKTYSNSLAPTNHEYCYSNFTRLETKVNSAWTKEVDQQTQEIILTPLHCTVMNYVKAYPIFFNKIQSIVDSLNLVNITTFGADGKIYGNYYMIWDVIKSALNKGIERLKIEIPVNEFANNGNDIDGNVLIQKHLTLLINYKWLFEEVRNLQEYPKDLSKSIDDLRDQELRAFVSSFARNHHIGNVIRLVEDLDNLVSNNRNPGNFGTYSVENIKSMMVFFKGDSFKQEIANIAHELMSILKGRCHNIEDPSKENKYSIAIGEHIEKEIYNNSLYTMCQLFISTFTKLSSIVDKYYDNFDIPVDKYIINFNFKKHYI